MKIVFLLFLLSISILTFSENKRDFEPLDLDRVAADLDTIKMEMDSTIYYVNGIYGVIAEEVKLIGLKKTILLNLDILFMLLLFVLFLRRLVFR